MVTILITISITTNSNEHNSNITSDTNSNNSSTNHQISGRHAEAEGADGGPPDAPAAQFL